MGMSISGLSGRYDAYHMLGERVAARSRSSGEAPSAEASQAVRTPDAARRAADPSRSEGRDGKPLSESDHRTVAELKQRDRAVRAHEQAHLAAGGALVRGGATYSFQLGPDGQRYAVGGEVSIDTSAGRSPEETIARAQAIKAAALAPADPSAADRAAAAKAAKLEAGARKELQARETEATGQAKPDSVKKAAFGEQEDHAETSRELAGKTAGADVVRGIAAYRAANEPAGAHAATSGLQLLA